MINIYNTVYFEASLTITYNEDILDMTLLA